MDSFSIASSVLGLVTLTGAVCADLNGYVQQIKRAGAEFQAVDQELQALEKGFEDIEQVTEHSFI